MKSETKFLKNTWYVAAWAHELSAQNVLARTIAKTPLIFWRAQNGNITALADRCCHRAAPLSAGRREGDNIRCMYHGLLFNRCGQCIQIPSQSAIPPAARVRAYPVIERSKWVWVWMGEEAKADPALIPDTHYLDDPGWHGRPGYLHYDANYLLITDNLLDFSHLSYVHEKTLGGSARYAGSKPKVSRDKRSVRVERWHLDDDPAPFLKNIKTWPGNVDRWNIYDVVLPGVLLMDSGSAPTGTGAPDGRRADAAIFFGCQAVTPETETSSHYFFQQSHGFALDDPSVTERLTESVLAGFYEDRDIIVAQQRALILEPEAPMVAMRMDVALFTFRTLMEEAIAQENILEPSTSTHSLGSV
jgi:phenylpropionate dioxygenase-like ring-hydroxylating dioxygenase large terminal subunit